MGSNVQLQIEQWAAASKPGPYKRKMCIFFEQHRCMKGASCTYAHSVEELQYAVMANAMADVSLPAGVAPRQPASGTVFDVKEDKKPKPKDDELDALLNDIIEKETEKDKKAKKRKREAALPPLPLEKEKEKKV